MRYIYSLIFGASLGAGSVFLYNLYPPFGFALSITATCLGIWAAGRKWGSRSYRFIVGITWALVVLRAGYPGLNEEYLIQGDSLGLLLINIGFIAMIISILTPL
jgi:hypothetical protein